MQDSYERQCEREAEHMVFDTAIAAFTETEQVMKSASRTMSIGSSSDLDSFVSATDVSILKPVLIVLTLTALQTKTDTFANSVDIDETAH